MENFRRIEKFNKGTRYHSSKLDGVPQEILDKYFRSGFTRLKNSLICTTDFIIEIEYTIEEL